MATDAQTAMPVPGLQLHTQYLDVADQQHLLAEIDTLPWLEDLRRRVQHYGYRYDYRSRSVLPNAYLGPLPDWAADLAERLTHDTALSQSPDQLIVNEYLPGQGISAHIDCVRCFGDVVLTISLGSSCVMSFSKPASGEAVDVLVHPGDLMVLGGDARYLWRHSIAARKSDVIGGRRMTRGRRVSLTFRTVVLDLD